MSSKPESVFKAYKAEADYSSSGGEFRIVKLSAEDTIAACSTKGEDSVGVLQNAPGSAEAAEVAISGGALIEAGGTVNLNQAVTCDANGKAIAPDAADQTIVGYALKAAVSGDIFPIIIDRGQAHASE